jgi:hypothetical protein
VERWAFLALTVVEPSLTYYITPGLTSVHTPGDVITFTVTIYHAAALASQSGAHAVAFQLMLDDRLTYMPGSWGPPCGAEAEALVNGTNTVLNSSVLTLSDGNSVTFTFIASMGGTGGAAPLNSSAALKYQSAEDHAKFYIQESNAVSGFAGLAGTCEPGYYGGEQ